MREMSADLLTDVYAFDAFTLVNIGFFALAVVLTLTGAWRLGRKGEQSGPVATPEETRASAGLYLLMLSVITTVAPLIGLLGTLVGLGVAFAASAEHSLDHLLSGAAVAINSSVAGVFAAVTAAIGQAVLRGIIEHLGRQPEPEKLPTWSPEVHHPGNAPQESPLLGPPAM
jgi:hypothetical protein